MNWLGKIAGSSKLLENGGSNAEEQPIFRTGLGKTVDVKKSSIARARSVLGDLDCTSTDAGMDFLYNICPIFVGRKFVYLVNGHTMVCDY